MFTFFLDCVGNGEVHVKVRVEEYKVKIDMGGKDLAHHFNSWGGDVGRTRRGSVPKELFIVQAGIGGSFQAEFGVGEGVKDQQCEVDGGIVYGGKRLLALGGYGETEDGAVGVVGVDGGQGRVEGHFMGMRVGVYIFVDGFRGGRRKSRVERGACIGYKYGREGK